MSLGQGIWARLVQIRYDRQIPQGAIAEAMNYTKPAVSQIENGKRNQNDLKAMTAYANALGLELEIRLVSRDPAFQEQP